MLMQSEVQRVDAPYARFAVIVPSWRPGPELLQLVDALQPCGFGALVVVDDGSGSAYEPVFAAIAARPFAKVLHYAANRGKGRALKTAFSYALRELPWVEGVVTADGDGQHVAADIAAVAAAMLRDRVDEAPSLHTVLGARTFAHGVPLRSRLGNALSRAFFRFATGVPVSDTQTGLRGLPRVRLAELVTLRGERYEYEMTMLAHLCRGGRPLEVPIRAIYVDGNRASHFAPVRDTARVSLVLLRLAAAGRRHLRSGREA